MTTHRSGTAREGGAGALVERLHRLRELRDERGAQPRLDDILDGETRNALARHDLVELVRSTNRNAADVPIESEEEAVILETISRGRQKITRDILATAAGRTANKKRVCCGTNAVARDSPEVGEAHSVTPSSGFAAAK